MALGAQPDGVLVIGRLPQVNDHVAIGINVFLLRAMAPLAPDPVLDVVEVDGGPVQARGHESRVTGEALSCFSTVK